jgi:prepilin-type N-terminal cleavage/methylation domain-containing protein
MGSRRACIRRPRVPARGYTLIELIIVVGLVLMLIALASFIDVHNYLGDAFRAERSTLVTVLQAARADSLNNVDLLPHGVAFHPADHPKAYVLFEGARYAESDPATQSVFEGSYPVSFDPNAPAEIVFCQLSGDATSGIGASDCEDPSNAFEGKVTMSDGIRGLTQTVTINHEGAIGW